MTQTYGPLFRWEVEREANNTPKQLTGPISVLLEKLTRTTQLLVEIYRIRELDNIVNVFTHLFLLLGIMVPKRSA